MATGKKEIKKELKIALDEVGTIQPWFDKEVNAWVFEHPFYPVRYAGGSTEEVLENYPKYLEVFIEHRMQNRIGEINERKTKGKGGHRPGSGRPQGTKKEPTKQVRLPLEIADWIKTPGVICHLQAMLQAYPAKHFLKR
jgi:hypothetical protein